MAERGKTYAESLAEEDVLKEQIYQYLEDNLKKLRQREKNAAAYAQSGAYEDQYAHIANRDYAASQKDEGKGESLYTALFPKPYFAHMEVNTQTKGPKQFMFSDNTALGETLSIGSCILVPFKRDKETPMLSELFKQYLTKQQGNFQVKGPKGLISYQISMSRDVEIEKRKLKSIQQWFPQPIGNPSVDSDKMLVEKLEENRANPALKNIIANLQKKQFEIISQPPEISFVVQGCAGSGKTQCLIHRLFYLRMDLSDQKWQKVLLLTPTQLFRNYSFGLMKSYGLTEIANYSLADLYKKLLESFDHRFKDRQYDFQLTEEYLPDEYLKQIYDEQLIQQIETMIENTIRKHVNEAGNLVGIGNFPERMGSKVIDELIKKLNDKIQAFDKRAELLAQNVEYKEHREALERQEQQIRKLQAQIVSLNQKQKQMDMEQNQYENLKSEIENAEIELKKWKEQKGREDNDLLNRCAENIKAVNETKEVTSLMWGKCFRVFFHALDAVRPFGNKYRMDKEDQNSREEKCKAAHQAMSVFTKGKNEETWLHHLMIQRQKIEEELQIIDDTIKKISNGIELHRERLHDIELKNGVFQDQGKNHQSEMEKSKNYLSRIENNVFEQEVWDTLIPLKTKYGIPMLKKDEHQKQNKILYKADLLFYLKIYLQLYGTSSLPEYKMLCIDEGQDLHKADYQLLRKLFPGAAINVFGDTAQVLHETCGVSDWEQDTGIRQKYDLDTNYRNKPALVKFCNQRFYQSMQFIGEDIEKDRPIICQNRDQLRKAVEDKTSVIIVKDRGALDALSMETGIKMDEFDFLDTKSKTAETQKISCYSIFAAKGLEFSRVLVYARGMTQNQKTVACTRAMQQLYYYE